MVIVKYIIVFRIVIQMNGFTGESSCIKQKFENYNKYIYIRVLEDYCFSGI